MPWGNQGLKIKSFEESGSDEYVYIQHNKKNGLDGKISRIGAWNDKGILFKILEVYIGLGQWWLLLPTDFRTILKGPMISFW